MSDAGVMEWRRDATAPSEETMFWFRGQVTAILRFSPTFAYLTITNSNECCDAVLRAEHGSSVTFIEQVVSTIEVGANVVVQGTRVAECAGDLREQAIQVTAIGLVDNVPDGSQSCEDGCLPPNALRVAREHESMAVKDEEDSNSGTKVDAAGTTTGCSEDDHHTVFVDALLEVLEGLVRDAVLFASGRPEALINADLPDEVARWAHALWPGGAARLQAEIDGARVRAHLNVNTRLLVEALLTRVARELGAA